MMSSRAVKTDRRAGECAPGPARVIVCRLGMWVWHLSGAGFISQTLCRHVSTRRAKSSTGNGIQMADPMSMRDGFADGGQEQKVDDKSLDDRREHMMYHVVF